MTLGRALLVAGILACAMLVSGRAATSAECRTLNIAAAEIPFFIESADKGAFVDLVRTAARRANLQVHIEVFPKIRALSLFRNGRVDALLPHSSAGQPVSAHKSIPILTKRDFAFVRKGTEIPRTIKDLEGLRVGLTRQYAYPESLTSNDRIDFSREPSSDLENIRMLALGRVDSAILEERSGLEALQQTGLDTIVYDKNYPINELLVWMLFNKTACGRSQMESMNAEFRHMLSNGEWGAILRGTPPES